MDLERDDLGDVLQRAGFASDEPACVGWLGVTPYLTAEAVLGTLGALAGLAAGSSVCLDYRVPASTLDPVSRAIDEHLAQRAAEAGEPWRSAFDPAELEARAIALGFAEATTLTPQALNARYYARRKDGLQMGGGLRILCARR